VVGSRPSEVLAENAAEVKLLLAAAGASNVRVFGSVAHGTDTPQSDVDILVDVSSDASLFALADAWDKVRSLLGFDVDLVTSTAVRPRLVGILDEAIAL